MGLIEWHFHISGERGSIAIKRGAGFRCGDGGVDMLKAHLGGDAERNWRGLDNVYSDARISVVDRRSVLEVRF
jgi:hypothetical protein